MAAGIYGATVIREGVEDRDDNETRFVWLTRGADAAALPRLRAGRASEWKTSVVFWGAGAGRPGWLLRCLQQFARREINLTKIESRPQRGRLGSYIFYVDLHGRAQETAVAEAIQGLQDICEEVRVLGSYPAAQRAQEPAG